LGQNLFEVWKSATGFLTVPAPLPGPNGILDISHPRSGWINGPITSGREATAAALLFLSSFIAFSAVKIHRSATMRRYDPYAPSGSVPRSCNLNEVVPQSPGLLPATLGNRAKTFPNLEEVVAVPPNIGMVSQPLRGCGVIRHVHPRFLVPRNLGLWGKTSSRFGNQQPAFDHCRAFPGPTGYWISAIHEVAGSTIPLPPVAKRRQLRCFSSPRSLRSLQLKFTVPRTSIVMTRTLRQTRSRVPTTSTRLRPP